MKARVATVLSLAGVLVAGSAAALVNNQVLRSTEPASSATLFAGSGATSTSTSTSTTLASEPSAATSIAPTTLRVYDIDKVGRITMDVANGNLRLVEGKEFDGWVVSKLLQSSATSVEVRFSNLIGTVVFTAELVDGEVTTDIEVEGLDGTSTSVTPSTTPTSGTTATTGGTTHTTVKRSTTTSVDDDDDDSPSTTDDHGGGGGGHGGDD